MTPRPCSLVCPRVGEQAALQSLHLFPPLRGESKITVLFNFYTPGSNNNALCHWSHSETTLIRNVQSAAVSQLARPHLWKTWICDISGWDPSCLKKGPTRNIICRFSPNMLPDPLSSSYSTFQHVQFLVSIRSLFLSYRYKVMTAFPH